MTLPFPDNRPTEGFFGDAGRKFLAGHSVDREPIEEAKIVPPNTHTHSFSSAACADRTTISRRKPTSAESAPSRGASETALAANWLVPGSPFCARTLLRTVGSGTLPGWALASILPIDALQAIAQDKKPREKTSFTVRLPCRNHLRDAVLIYGDQLGSYAKEGLEGPRPAPEGPPPGIALIPRPMISRRASTWSHRLMPGRSLP